MSHENSKITKGAAHAIKNAWAEPFAKKVGTRLGKFLLGYPAIVDLLNSAGPEGKKFASTAVRGGGGVIQLPGSGPLIYIFNEAFDAFAGGLGDALEEFENMSEVDLANNSSVSSAVAQATARLEGVLNSEVTLKDRWYHLSSCPEARGKKLTLRDAMKFGYLPMNCHCFGEVFNVPDEEEAREFQPTPVLNIIELMDEIELEAVETENEVLLGQITHFNEAFFSLSPELQLKFEYLAKEKRPMQNLKLLIGKPEKNWEATLEAMLDNPAKARTDGLIKTVTKGLGKIGERIAEKATSEEGEMDRLVDGIGTGIRHRSDELDLRYAEQLRDRAFMKSFRKARAEKWGWFHYLSYGTFIFALAFITYHAITH